MSKMLADCASRRRGNLQNGFIDTMQKVSLHKLVLLYGGPFKAPAPKMPNKVSRSNSDPQKMTRLRTYSDPLMARLTQSAQAKVIHIVINIHIFYFSMFFAFC